MRRRKFILRSMAATSLGVQATRVMAQPQDSDSTFDDRVQGLLLGGLIGDALGGPIEFAASAPGQTSLTDARRWDDRRLLTYDELDKLASSVPVLGYEQLRPSTAPYGPWVREAPAGTLTDDSRHKVILLRALQDALEEDVALSKQHIAREFLDFSPAASEGNSRLKALNAEGFQEYRYASRWLLGERDLKLARPLERLWAGINNCSGQMMFPPIAVAYAGEPEAAYRAVYELDFIDAPQARDMAASLIAGLAAALGDPEKVEEKTISKRWDAFFDALENTDPYSLRDVPFAGRPLQKWLERVDEFVTRAKGSPKKLYRILEEDGKPVYWWDAHFTLIVPLCMLKICNRNPMAAMHLALDFGHDTDSYAQVLGCIIGTVHGQSVFSEAMITPVRASLARDYSEDTLEWQKRLSAYRRFANGSTIRE